MAATSKKNVIGVTLQMGLEDIWKFLTIEQQELLLDEAIQRTYEKGEHIYKVGDGSEYLVCILRGRVKLEKAGAGGRMQIIRLLRTCEFFGYRSYFASQVHSTSAVAIDHTIAALIPMKLIELITTQNLNLAMYFIRALSLDLGVSDERTVSLTQKHIRARLADALLFLIDKYGWESDGTTVNAYLSREEIAALSNMTTSNAIRTLSAFEKEGIIRMDGRRIIIRDLNAVKENS